MNDKSTDERMAEVATEAAKKYVKTSEFRKKIDAKCHTEIEGLIEKSRKKVLLWAGGAASLMFLVFIGTLTLQYLNIREKRTQIYEQYVDALSLIQTLDKTITETKGDVEARLNTMEADIDTRVNAIEAKVRSLESDTASIELNINRLREDVKLVKKELTNQQN